LRVMMKVSEFDGCGKVSVLTPRHVFSYMVFLLTSNVKLGIC
jgi:hypothetical protein